MPKIVHRREKQPLLGPVYVYMHKYIYKTINLDLKIQGQQFPYTLHYITSNLLLTNGIRTKPNLNSCTFLRCNLLWNTI